MKKRAEAEGLDWLSRHSHIFKKHAGMWIAFTPHHGRFAVGEVAKQTLKSFRRLYPSATPNLFHIPRLDEGPYVLWRF
jgi:hypothetical protein